MSPEATRTPLPPKPRPATHCGCCRAPAGDVVPAPGPVPAQAVRAPARPHRRRRAPSGVRSGRRGVRAVPPAAPPLPLQGCIRPGTGPLLRRFRVPSPSAALCIRFLRQAWEWKEGASVAGFPDSAFALAARLLDPDPWRRPSAAQALAHPFLAASQP